MNKNTAQRYDQNRRKRWLLDRIHAFKQSLAENENKPSPDYELNKEPHYAPVIYYLGKMAGGRKDSVTNGLAYVHIWSGV